MSKKRFHIIATIYDKKGRPLSIGVNSYVKTHPMQAKYAAMYGRPEQIYLHAEMAAIVKLKKPWLAHTIKVERYDNEGNPVSAKPCPICQAAIDALKIPFLIHT
jgi:tRNA(Arg) A34 adenosine deaminase TadA